MYASGCLPLFHRTFHIRLRRAITTQSAVGLPHNSNTRWSVASSSRKGPPYLGIVSNQECNHYGDACASLSGIRLSLSSSTKVTTYFVQICHDCG